MEGIINETNLKYLISLRPKLDPVLTRMQKFAKKNDIPIISVEVGKFLELITLIKDPDKVLEVGMAIGFSGIFIARALKMRGKLTTIEKSLPNINLARSNFTEAGIVNKVEIIPGDATKVLPELEGPFDMAFLDAQKEEYKDYLKYTIELMNPGGVIIVDNLLWHGQTAGGPAISEKYAAATKALVKFNKHFINHPDLISTILPVGDGIGFAIVK